MSIESILIDALQDQEGIESIEVDPSGKDVCEIALAGRDGSTLHIHVAPPGSVRATCLATEALDAWIPTNDLDAGQRRLAETAIDALRRIGADRIPEAWQGDRDPDPGRFVDGDVAEVKITTACDQACVFCKSPPGMVNQAGVEETLRLLPALATRARMITISGGEPTTHPRLRDVVEAARGAGFHRVEVQTNGMRLASGSLLDELVDARMTHLLVSLHAHEEGLSDHLTRTRGGFRRTVRTIGRALATDLHLSVCHVICAGNHRHLETWAVWLHRRFTARPLRVVFTLAVPTYRVRAAPGLMPALGDVAPRLRAALAHFEPATTGPGRISGGGSAIVRLVSPVVNRLGRRLGPARAHRASVIAGCGLPPCVLGIRAHYHEETASGCSARAGEHLVHPDTCEACTWRDVCSGLWPEYVEVHGVHDIRPVLADPLETVR